MKRALFTFMLLLAFLAAAQTSTQMKYTYTLSSDMTNVTIGVKDSTGALIKTISAGEPRNAGTYTGIWNGLTDGGIAATGGPFSITVLYGNPTYSWNGQIGTTSNNWAGYDRWNVFQVHSEQIRFVFVNGTGWATAGYAEGAQALAYFSDQDPNTPHPVNVSMLFNSGIQFNDIATDGQFLYLENTTSGGNGQWSWVTKLDAQTGQPAFFSDPSINSCTPTAYTPPPTCNGMLATGPYFGALATGNNGIPTYPGIAMSIIDIQQGVSGTSPPAQPPTSIAVQIAGNVLAVGHGNYFNGVNTPWHPPNIATNNDIKFFDKNTGLPIGSDVTLANPTSMAFSSAGLWVVGDGVLTLVTNPGSLIVRGRGQRQDSREVRRERKAAKGMEGRTASLSNPIAGLSYPMAVDTGHGPNNTDHIYVLDGGASQQLKEFDASYNLVRTYGVAGGYRDCNPNITSNRLMLDGSAIYGTNGANPYFGNINFIMPWVRVENNGDVWVMDQFQYWMGGAEVRIQHFTPSGNAFQYVNQILNHGYSYQIAIPHNAPTRVFQNMLEYQVNWDVPNNPGDPSAPGGNGSWKLVRAWTIGAGASAYTTPTVCGNTNLPFTMLATARSTNFQSVEQINGHMYATIAQGGGGIYAPAVGGLWVVELPSSGVLRYIAPAPVGGSTNILSIGRNGDIHYFTNSGTGAGASQNLYMKKFNGLDASNNPQWAATATLLQTVTYNATTQPTLTNNPIPSLEPTTNGVYPGMQWCTYSTGNVGTGKCSWASGSATNTSFPHVAGILPGRSSYLYTVAPEVCVSQTPINGTFPCGTGSNGGNVGQGPFVEGHQFVVAHASQAQPFSPMFWHYWEDGMFIGQFGGWHTNSWSPVGPNVILFPSGYYGAASQGASNRFSLASNTLGWRGSAPQLAGIVTNVGGAALITSPTTGNMYLNVANEGINMPIAVWQIANISSIHEIAGNGNLGQAVIVNQAVF